MVSKGQIVVSPLVYSLGRLVGFKFHLGLGFFPSLLFSQNLHLIK